jgi:hypothetical protein
VAFLILLNGPLKLGHALWRMAGAGPCAGDDLACFARALISFTLVHATVGALAGLGVRIVLCRRDAARPAAPPWYE